MASLPGSWPHLPQLLAAEWRQLTDGGAAFEVELVDGPVVKHSRLSIIDERHRPQIDGVEYLETPIPSGATAVDLKLREFAFDFDANAVASGNIAFKMKNAGRQHEAVPREGPGGRGLRGCLPIHRASSLPGPQRPGRYTLVCFLPDTDDPEGTPHAFKGMIGGFTIE